MEMSPPVVDAVRQWSLPMTEPSQVFEARWRATHTAREMGLSEGRAGTAALIVTEAGNNLVKHADRGELIVGGLIQGARRGIEILSVDRGPGMSNLGECLRDGYSTAGTSGTGFGAIRRQADEFDVHTLPGRGTVLLARLWTEPRALPSGALEVGTVCLPVRGEGESGDRWDVTGTSSQWRFLVADGIGHGRDAAVAAGAAVAVLRSGLGMSLTMLIESMHGALKPTRGAVVAVADLELRTGFVTFAGVGNISGCIWTPSGTQSLVSMNGTVGHVTARVREFSYRWPSDGLLILHSDGLNTRWDLADYPGLSARDPSLVAAVLYRDWSRGRDDVTVLVARRKDVA
jgi:anti-sigma regulatory factor (Ser/Thr protein kinase)